MLPQWLGLKNCKILTFKETFTDNNLMLPLLRNSIWENLLGQDQVFFCEKCGLKKSKARKGVDFLANFNSKCDVKGSSGTYGHAIRWVFGLDQAQQLVDILNSL